MCASILLFPTVLVWAVPLLLSSKTICFWDWGNKKPPGMVLFSATDVALGCSFQPGADSIGSTFIPIGAGSEQGLTGALFLHLISAQSGPEQGTCLDTISPPISGYPGKGLRSSTSQRGLRCHRQQRGEVCGSKVAFLPLNAWNQTHLEDLFQFISVSDGFSFPGAHLCSPASPPFLIVKKKISRHVQSAIPSS